ncbi:uncharacterized protein NEPG_01656 [Nematocida parisii ERTm1]|nr:uncharacterized protein NEPG_01656 [Nematocida parisii ERTm1]EIJ93314.1 hypothetical protein NEPG_01656 [Nematocida parisii ERTm1]|eukprot:XP_013059484.1 hypothetical protein NEPG_01656 [Nematocida parisii ERTm1]
MRRIKILLIIFLLCILIAIGIVVYEIIKEISVSESETSSEAYDSTESDIIKSSISAQRIYHSSTQQNKNQATPIVAPAAFAINPRSSVDNSPLNHTVPPTTSTTSKVEVFNRHTVDSTSLLGDVSTTENQGSIYDWDSKKLEEQTQSIQSSVNVEKDDLAKNATVSTDFTASRSRLYPRLEDDINDERVSIDPSPKYTKFTTVYAHKLPQLSTESGASHAALDLDDQQTTSLSRGIDAVSSITKEKEKEEQKEKEEEKEKKEIKKEEEKEEKKMHLESNLSSFKTINSNDKSRSIKKVEAVSTITPPAADPNYDFTLTIPVEEENNLESTEKSLEAINPNKEGAIFSITSPAAGQSSGSTATIPVKEENNLKTKEELFETIDSSLDGATAEEKELVGMLNDIAKSNPALPRVNYSKDKEIINAIIKNKDVVVVEMYFNALWLKPKKLFGITLWKVLNNIVKKDKKQLELYKNSLITNVAISYPKELQHFLIITHALLGYYKNTRSSMNCLTLNGFNFSEKAHVFSKYDIFNHVKTLTLSRTHIFASTLSQLIKNSRIYTLNIYNNTVIDFDSKLDLSSSCILTVEIDGIDGKCIDPLLTGLAKASRMSRMSITNIDFMSASALKNLAELSNVHEFTLQNIVFEGSPDFSFLRKMDKLFTLTMHNIFYSYTNEFKIEDLDKIKQNPEEYLRITAEPEDSSAQKQIELNKSDDIVRKNKALGESISPNLMINIDGKLYNDLGLCKLKSKNNNNFGYIRLQLAPSSLNAKAKQDSFIFSFKKTKLEVFIDIGKKKFKDVIDCLKCIDFPFTRETVIDEIIFISYYDISNDCGMMETISDRLFKYAEHNKIKKITVSSFFTPIPMDMYRVVMFNSKMPTLKEMTLSNIKLTPTKTPAQNDDEKKALESYCTFIEKNSFYKELHIVKDGNIMKIEQKPKK